MHAVSKVQRDTSREKRGRDAVGGPSRGWDAVTKVRRGTSREKRDCAAVGGPSRGWDTAVAVESRVPAAAVVAVTSRPRTARRKDT